MSPEPTILQGSCSSERDIMEKQISGTWYDAYFDEENYLLKIHHKSEHLYYYLSLFSEVNTPEDIDINADISPPRLLPHESSPETYMVEIKSSLWDKKRTYYDFYPDRIEIRMEIYGKGDILRAFFFRGRYEDREYGCVPGFDVVKTGQANFLNAELFHIAQPLSVTVSNDSTYWGSALSGGPLMYSFSNGLRTSYLGVCCCGHIWHWYMPAPRL